MKYLAYSILLIITIYFSSCCKNETTPTSPTCNNQLLYGKYKSTSNGDTIIIGDDIQNLNNKDGWCVTSPDSINLFSYKSKYEYCVNSNNTMSIKYTGPCKIYFINSDILPYTLSNGTLTFGTPTTNNQVYSLKNIANTSFVKL